MDPKQYFVDNDCCGIIVVPIQWRLLVRTPRAPVGYRGQLSIHALGHRGYRGLAAVTAVIAILPRLPRSIGHPFLDLDHRGYRVLAAVTAVLSRLPRSIGHPFLELTLEGQAQCAKGNFGSICLASWPKTHSVTTVPRGTVVTDISGTSNPGIQTTGSWA